MLNINTKKMKVNKIIKVKDKTIVVKKPFKQKIKEKKMPLLILDLIKWKIIDIRRNIKFPKKPHLYGIKCIAGMYGCGKTVTMTYVAMELREKFGNDIYICSNYGLDIQDFAFNDIKMLVEQYDKPIVYFWDEVQNDFPSTEKNFPRQVRQALTLNRKGNGKLIYWASQDHELVHKTIRRLTIEYGQVKTLFKRYTRVRWYLSDDYDRLFNENNFDKKRKIHPIKTQKFIQTDELRSMYNSFSWDNGEKLTNEII